MVNEMTLFKSPTTKLLTQAKRLQFKAKVLLLAVGLVQGLSSTPAVASDEKLKEETELHLSLTEEAFSKLIQNESLSPGRSQRTDLYFDSHNGSEFVLRRNLEEGKLRIQIRADSLVVQKSWLLDSTTLNTGDFEWMVSRRSSSVMKQSLDGNLSEKIAQSTTVLKSGVASLGVSPSQKTFLENIWSTFAWPQLNEFDSAAQRWPLQWVPAALVKKERWLFPLPSTGKNNAPLYIQLGRDTDVFGSGKPQAFEVEVEFSPDSEESESEVADKVSFWLLQRGIVTDDSKVPARFDFFTRLEGLYPKTQFRHQ